MNQSDNISVVNDFLPDNLIEKVVVKKAYVAKVGFVRIKSKEDFQKTLLAKLVTNRKHAFDEYINEIFKVLSKSPNIMDIFPSQKTLKKNLVIQMSPDGATLDSYLKMRVVMPLRRQKELFSAFSKSFAPEEFI